MSSNQAFLCSKLIGKTRTAGARNGEVYGKE